MKKLSLILVLFLTCFANFALYNFPATKNADLKTAIIGFDGRNDDSIRILAFGDVMLGRYVRTLMERNDLYYPFKKTLANKDWLAQFDIMTANLEGPITKRFVTGGTAMTFGFPPDTAQILKNLGFTAVGLANNHMYDRGGDGFDETIKYLSEAGVGYYGNYNDAAMSPGYFVKVKDKKIAFLAFNDVFGILDIKEAQNLIREVKKGVDYVFVFPHWGIEYQHQNSKRQQELGHRFIDAGADAVIGHHPHVVQNYEEYNGKTIFYSLGNYVFDQYFRKDVQEGLAIGIQIMDGRFRFEIYEMKSDRSQPYFVTSG